MKKTTFQVNALKIRLSQRENMLSFKGNFYLIEEDRAELLSAKAGQYTHYTPSCDRKEKHPMILTQCYIYEEYSDTSLFY